MPRPPARGTQLLSVAAALGYFNLLYYLRCVYKFGPLSITIVQVLVKDVFEMLTIYCTIMIGFALAFHLLMSTTACSDSDVSAPRRRRPCPRLLQLNRRRSRARRSRWATATRATERTPTRPPSMASRARFLPRARACRSPMACCSVSVSHACA